MSNVRRRTVLTAAGVTGLAVALPAPQIAFAENPRDDATTGESSLLANIVGRVAGTVYELTTLVVMHGRLVGNIGQVCRGKVIEDRYARNTQRWEVLAHGKLRLENL